METDRPRFISPITLVAVLAATLPGLAQAVTNQTAAVTYALIAIVTVALVTSTFGIAWAERRPGMRPLAAVASVYGLCVGSSIWLSHGGAFLVAMPFISMMVLFFPMPVALAVNALLTVLVAFAIAPLAADTRQLLAGIAGFASSVAFVMVFSLIARRERYARRDVERLNKQVEELATARERNRIAREIHDSLGHYLTIANVQVEAARATVAGRDERLLRVQQLLRDGLSELRSSVSLLREGASAPKPFVQALDGLVAECNATGLSAELTTQGPARPLPADVGFTLFRAAQEALTNVQRHANARKVSVTLDYRAARVRLHVLDDGVGGTVAPGNGLNGLRERVAQVGGTLAIDAPAGGGLRVTVEVPA